MLLSLLAGCCLSACSEQAALGPVIAAASAHLATFERFERWAERCIGSDVRLRGVQALRETLFAPLRRERTVAWATVQTLDGRELVYRTPLTDAKLSFVPIEAPALGRVRVAMGENGCVVIERPEVKRSARVRIGFCKAESEPQASR